MANFREHLKEAGRTAGIEWAKGASREDIKRVLQLVPREKVAPTVLFAPLGSSRLSEEVQQLITEPGFSFAHRTILNGVVVTKTTSTKLEGFIDGVQQFSKKSRTRAHY